MSNIVKDLLFIKDFGADGEIERKLLNKNVNLSIEDHVDGLRYIIKEEKWESLQDVYGITKQTFVNNNCRRIIEVFPYKKSPIRFLDIVFNFLGISEHFEPLDMKWLPNGTWNEPSNIRRAYFNIYNKMKSENQDLVFNKDFVLNVSHSSMKKFGYGGLLAKFKNNTDAIFSTANFVCFDEKIDISFVFTGITSIWSKCETVKQALYDIFEYKKKSDPKIEFNLKFLYNLSKEDFHRNHAALSEYYDNNRYNIIIAAQIDGFGVNEIKPYSFRPVPRNTWKNVKENKTMLREFFLYLFVNENENNVKDLKTFLCNLSYSYMTDCGFRGVLSNATLHELMFAADFENIHIHVWEVAEMPQKLKFPKNKENRIAYMNYFRERMNYPNLEDLYKTTAKQLLDNHGSWILSYYNGSPVRFIKDVYPNTKWDKKKFKHGVSQIEVEWIESLILKEGIRDMIYINSKGGQFTIPGTKYRVDGYSQELNTVYEMLGNYWHGNLNKYARDDYNSTCKMTMGELYDRTMDRLKNIENTGYKVRYIWESDYLKQEREENKRVKAIAKQR